jgi:hypothetical protein
MMTPKEKAARRLERFRIAQQALRTVEKAQTIFIVESDEIVFGMLRILLQTRGYDLQIINVIGNKRQVMVIKNAG